jgi:hypothetical protein
MIAEFGAAMQSGIYEVGHTDTRQKEAGRFNTSKAVL